MIPPQLLLRWFLASYLGHLNYHFEVVAASLTKGLLCAVATPKQICELMKVDGLTNDEVKSHLQVHIMRLFFLRIL
jgi:hypothetical protein